MNRLQYDLWKTSLAALVLLQVHVATPLFAQEPNEPTIGSQESFAGPPTQATQILRGHLYSVETVAISPDRTTIASGGGMSKLPRTGKPGVVQSFTVKELQALTKGEAITWDLKSTKRKATLTQPPGVVIGLSFSPNGNVIGGCLHNPPFADGLPKPAVVFWDATKGKPARQYMGLTEPTAMAFLPDGMSVIVADGKTAIFDGGFSGPVAFGDFGKNAVVRQPGGVIRVLEYPAFTVSHEIDLRKVNCTSNVHIDPMRVAYKQDQKTHVFDAATGRDAIVPAEIPNGHMRLSPDGKVIAILCEKVADKHLLQFFSVENGAAIGKPAAVIATWEPTMTFSSDSRWLALTPGWANDESLICLWDIANRQEIARFAGHKGGVNSLAFASDDSVLVSGGDDKTVKIWKLPAK